MKDTRGWLPVAMTAGFALAGAIALGYALVWFQGGGALSLFDIFEPQKEYTHEEKLEILASLKSNAEEDIPEEEKMRILHELYGEVAEARPISREEKLQVLQSLRGN